VRPSLRQLAGLPADPMLRTYDDSADGQRPHRRRGP
jgi:hypothetical protein